MTTLVVMAAGLGSRYGDLKQMDAMGPHDETVLDYSVFDAMQAGFNRVVFVIRAEFEDAFKDRIGSRYANRMDVAYALQDLRDVPEGYCVSPERTKPWGTVHAVLAARAVLYESFAVVNADDFYGREAYQRIFNFFNNAPGIPSSEGDHYCMVGYKTCNTLSSSGGVNRGICVERDGFLVTVEEHTNIAIDIDTVCRGNNLSGHRVPVSLDAISSMNIWGFTPTILTHMAHHFELFLAKCGTSLTAECYIPSVVDDLIRMNHADCQILPTSSNWFGVTYPQDKAVCVQKIHQLIDAGVYKANLWG